MNHGTKPQSLIRSGEEDLRRFKGNDAHALAALYDEYAGVVLGFLEKIADDKAKAEELLQVVFLALPAQIGEFDPEKGRLVTWILRLARNVAGTTINGGNVPTNGPIRNASGNVDIPNTAVKRRLMPVGKEYSVIELLYVKGYTFAEAAAELGVDETAVKTLVRTELKKYRKDNPNV